MDAQRRDLMLRGDANDLFSHMALWGLVRICTNEGIAGIRGYWTDEPEPKPVLSTITSSPEEIAQKVKEHASARAAGGSWLHEVFVPRPGSNPVALMAPRTATPELSEWNHLEDLSNAVRDNMPSDLDRELILGLGYRSWWAREANGDIRADKGCSVWEMRTRNKGTDFVADRLLPLAHDISKWSVDKIWAGLTGKEVDDSTGGNKPTSRTATGFRLPGPVDSARAWCALWALSLFPVLPHPVEGGRSPAFVPLTGRGNIRRLLLFPVPTDPTSVERIAMLARSKALVEAATVPPTGPDPESALHRKLMLASAQRWLRNHGLRGVMQFPVQIVGSTSAPERQTLAGSFVAS
ncbi:MAG: hypothetical protein QM708_06800 [Propioniciclava sp.]|uniref:hypothetical protein n=1 Tax=Propioniciclava sp. TaxID=2038686 RepID=UPI0039E6B3E4